MMVAVLASREAFREELLKKTQEFNHWALEYVDAAGQCRSTAVLRQGDEGEELTEVLNGVDEEYERLQTALADQKANLERYKQWITHVKENDARYSERIPQLLEAKRRGEDKVSICMAEISSKLDHRKQKLDALRKATSWYKELLGIRCEYSNAVKFIFTNIDPIRPEREFCFSIHHDKIANKFSMTDCNPHIDKSGPLLDSLNTSNELSQFVRSMRWEFVALALSESLEQNLRLTLSESNNDIILR